MRTILNPNLYHGKNKKKNFFEGWYYKLVTKDSKLSFAIIPGIALGNNKNSGHSFIQILCNQNNFFKYIEYEKNDFSVDNSDFEINLSNNKFKLTNINLNIHCNNFSINGNLKFSNIIKWKDSFINPGSMGFYNYLKFMECYSQVCVIDGDILGFLNVNGTEIDFNGGKVYIEKNWGKSFPIEWLWIQSNSFLDSRATVTCSIAQIPFPFKSFRGFLVGITVDNVFYKFTTINRSKLYIDFSNNNVEVTITKGDLILKLKTFSNYDEYILCKGPQNGIMSPYVKETLSGKVHMQVKNLKLDKLIYEGIGLSTGIEYGGKYLNNKKISKDT